MRFTLHHRPRTPLLAGSAMLLAFTLTGCVPGPGATEGSTPTGSTAAGRAGQIGTVETVALGVQTPWSLVDLGDDTVVVSERDTGRIAQLESDGDLRTITIVEDAVHNGEGGLLGLAAHQDWLYAYATTASDNRVVRFPITRQGDRVVLGAASLVIDGIPAASHHNGGRIAFGPDGMLYVTAGDAGRSSDAQDRAALGGKILRLEPDGSIPTDNPTAGSPVYSLGHRNPQGLAWDEDGTLYAAEFGQNTWDELNVIGAGQNYGWPTVEGVADDDRFVNPVQQWTPSDASPSGIAVADDRIWIANLRGRSLRVVPLTDLTTSTTVLEADYGRIRDVSLGQDGDLWLLTSNTDGRGTAGTDDDRVLRLDLDS